MTPQPILLIAVSYFGSADAKGLLRSLQQQTTDNWHLIIVDNSMDDGEVTTLESLTASESRASVVRAPSNLGYFGAANYIASKLDTIPDWVIICNMDLVLGDEHTLANLRGHAFPDDVGVVAPRIISQRNNREQNPFLRSRPTAALQHRRWKRLRTPLRAQLTIFGAYIKRRLSRRRPELLSRTIYAPHGSFIAVRSVYFLRGGNLQHPVFLFSEEFTLADQTERLGLKIAYFPNIVIRHVEHGQMGFLRSRTVLTEMGHGAKYALDLMRAAEANDHGTAELDDSLQRD